MPIVLKSTDIYQIDQEIKKYTNKKISYTFNPYLLPTFRGILSSIYVNLKKEKANNLLGHLKRFYKNSKFVKIKN